MKILSITKYTPISVRSWPARIAPLALSAALALPVAARADTLLVSRSTYSWSPSAVTVGQTLPGGGTAVADGSFPTVFNNEVPDPSFGITSPIWLDQLDTNGTSSTTVSSLNLTNALASQGVNISTSFPSKSELALNTSSDGSAVTFMAYASPINQLDVSNSNTPNHVDTTNPVSSVTQRAVVQLNSNGSVQVTDVNAYSGNNGRAAILANGNYYMVGNAGNGSGTEPSNIVSNTGVQMIAAGNSGETTVVGAKQGSSGNSTGFQYGYTVTQNGLAADKSGKDDNFRGLTVFNNTLYVTKGSGNNGIDSVYQVGTTGTLPTAATAATTAISILNGFPTNGAKDGKNSSGTVQTIYHPFGLWFANASTLYVGDEGDGTSTNATSGVGGLQKWTFDGTKWNLAYTLKTGLGLGQNYNVAGYTAAVATDGIRNIAGKVNSDGTVTIYGVTSTYNDGTIKDSGADPNRLVAITDSIGLTDAVAASGESFTTLETAGYGEVLRGVALTTVIPEPSTYAIILGSLSLGVVLLRRRRV